MADGDLRRRRISQDWTSTILYLASAAAFGCARTLGASRPASVVATCWFASSMPLLIFSFEPNVDTIFVAGYLLATYFFLQAACAEESLAEFSLGALAAGLAMGTKPTAILFIPPLLAIANLHTLRESIPIRTKIVRDCRNRVCALIDRGILVRGQLWY